MKQDNEEVFTTTELKEYDNDLEEVYYWIEIHHIDYRTFALPEGSYKFTLTYNETQGDGCVFLYDSAAIWFEDYGFWDSFRTMELVDGQGSDESDSEEGDGQGSTQIPTTSSQAEGIHFCYLFLVSNLGTKGLGSQSILN